MHYSSNVMEDGYTKRGYLKENPGVHQHLLFEYRPLLPAEVEEVDDKMKSLPAVMRMKLLCSTIAARLKSWSECYRNAEGDPDPSRPVPITGDNVGRLGYNLVADLKMVVWGFAAGDPIPGATDQEDSEFLKAALAEAEGRPAGLSALEDERKN